MGAFKGYFDESGDDCLPHNALAVCGYVSTVKAWKAFEVAWAQALADNGAPWLHMKDLQNPHGELARFAGKQNEAARSKFLSALACIIERAELVCVGSVIRLPDLKEFNHDKGLNLEALPLAMYFTMLELYRLYRDDTLELVIDRGIDSPEQTIATAIDYAKSHVHDDVGERMAWQPLKGDNSFRNVLPIQAADFIAWEARKEHERKNGWWRDQKRGLAVKDWVVSEGMWLGRQGKPWPNLRQSLNALANATELNIGHADYDFICGINEARYGVWTIAERDHWRKEEWPRVAARRLSSET